MAAIELRDVHKTFRIPHEVHTTLTERLLSLFRPVSYERFEALRGVDLEIESGAFVGIIGGNGSGKSTLLKIMSGLLPPDRGSVRVDGSMSALLELGLGFSNELTVRENVELYAAVLGYPRREVQRRVDEAIDFAGLDRFRDAKLKNLSTGMRARLGFATALQAESDILMLDEILAVGDADFQLKCLNVFEDLKRRRKTMVLVSHDLGQVQRFCDEAIWLNKGVIGARGDPDHVIAEYLKTVGTETEEVMTRPGRQRMQSDDCIKILDVWLENDAGRRIGRVRSGDQPTIVVRAAAREDVDQPVLGIQVDADDGTWIYSSCTKDTEVRGVVVPAGQTIEWRLRYTAALRNGRYTVMVGIANRDQTTFHDLVRGALDFVVHGSLCPPQGAPDFGGRVSHTDLQGRYTYRLGVELTAGDAHAADEPPRTQQKGGVR